MSAEPGTPFAVALTHTRSSPDLPSEILGQCFQFLPFLDRFRAAHVSRYWHACALSFPSLWADIHLSAVVRAPSRHALLHLALSRSAPYPVDFECSTIFDLNWHDAILRLLSRHMHRVRSIVWSGSIDSAGFTSPAPVLERYIYRSPNPIPQNLFGGQAGALRHVELSRPVLPEACPAFACVTHLAAEVPGSEAASSLSRLFFIFPSLVSLSLRGLPRDDQHLLHLGRAPRTLTCLSLQTESVNCNLAQYADELAPAECRHLRFVLPVQAITQLALLVTDALELAILPHQAPLRTDELARLVTSLPTARVLTLEFDAPIYVHPASDILVGGLLERAGLAQLRALTMPLYTVQMFFRTRPMLPSLSELCIIIPQADLPLQVVVLDLTRLYCLALLRPYALACCTLDISTHRRPSAEDAAGVLEHIAKYGQAGVRYVLRGFPSDVVDAVPIPAELGGFEVHFE